MIPNTVFAVLIGLVFSGCVANPTAIAQTFEGKQLRFVAGEFRAKAWGNEILDGDKHWNTEDRFPFISKDKLLFLEIKGRTQRVSAIKLDNLLNIKDHDGLLFDEWAYPSRKRRRSWETDIPRVVAMYRGDAVLEENRQGQRSLKSLPDGKEIRSNVPIRDYMKVRNTEWLVYPKWVEKRKPPNFLLNVIGISDSSSENFFQCNDVYSVDVQNNTIAVGYKDENNQSRVCVWDHTQGQRNCDCENSRVFLNNVTNPVLSQDGRYLAVAQHNKDRGWDLKVGPVDNFDTAIRLVSDIKFYDIRNKMVFYRNSYAWLGHTLFLSKRNEPLKLYQISCYDNRCNEPQAINLPAEISVCGIKTWALQQDDKTQFSTDEITYVTNKLGHKNNHPLWFQVAENCKEFDKKSYEVASIKWSQPFLVGGKPYLATESRLKFIGSGGRWITRILIFAIEIGES